MTVLVLALGIAVGSALVFGVSMALGAFLAGMVVGRSDYSLRAASEALPMRDAFAVLFFVSVGMLLDPQYLLEAPGSSWPTLAVVMRRQAARRRSRSCRLHALSVQGALAVAVALAQIGEFSFILATLGRDLGILSPEATQHARGRGDHLDRRSIRCSSRDRSASSDGQARVRVSGELLNPRDAC